MLLLLLLIQDTTLLEGRKVVEESETFAVRGLEKFGSDVNPL